MIIVDGEITVTDKVIVVPLSQDEATSLILDLQRALCEAKDHKTTWPITMMGRGGYQQRQLRIDVSRDNLSPCWKRIENE
jgi:hypothetical protein